MFDWTLYTGNLKWLPSCTIYLTKHGSQAYGTALPTSDTDIRGVAIAPKEYYLGVTQVFKQAEQKEPDLTIFELRKFLAMASECNPNVLELLHTDPEDHLELADPLGGVLLGMRDWFLTTRVRHTFSGYATQQLRRINTHYRWLKNPPTAKPTREEFKLPERTLIPKDQLAAANAAIQKKMDEWSWHDLEHLDPVTRQAIKDEFFRRLCEITQWAWTEVEDKTWRAAANTLGYDTNFIRLMDLERQYTNRLSEWNKYQEWKAKRNPARAELEEKFGFDTKHGMHLVRLLRMCREILETGEVRVRRPDAQELLGIRHGAWDYFQLVEWAGGQDKEMAEVAKNSKLPRSPDLDKINDRCIDMVEYAHYGQVFKP
jgi:predicted nucleotidyltransferase